MPVQEHDRVERLVLCGRRDLALHGQMGEKRFHLGRAPSPRDAAFQLPMEQDEAPDPIDVGVVGADAVVQPLRT